jgi:hypothetical protein
LHFLQPIIHNSTADRLHQKRTLELLLVIINGDNIDSDDKIDSDDNIDRKDNIDSGDQQLLKQKIEPCSSFL